MMATVATHSITERILCPICRAENRSDARFCQQCGNDVLLDNRYRITRVIKEGGMGIVYQAIDEDGQFYAVKEMHDRFTNEADRADGIARFEDEAKLLARLRGHPNIPQVYGFFIDEGRYYLAMEFIFGEDLEDVLKRTPRFSEEQVLQWADQLCDVLEFLHQYGLIYRDMKPSNVMIQRGGEVKVVDFGIAKLLQPGQRGTMIGTPGYAPPEQYQGIATVQSDIYALAATLHHLVTGRDPREEPPFSFPRADEVDPRIKVSRATSDALEKGLQMELQDRFKTVSEFRRALPIPTGDRRPTRTFDPAPRAEPRPQPPVQAAPRPQSQVKPLPPAPRSVPQTQPRRRGGFGRAVRRIVVTGLVAGGLGFGLVQFQPELAAEVGNFITNTVPQYIENLTQQAPSNPQPNGFTVLTPYEAPLEVEVTEGATDEVILQKFREEFLVQARQQYPQAELSSTIPPLYAGGAPEVVTTGPGYVRLRATMSGFLNVPSQ
jgi:serine/threonine-protein kinase